MFISMNCLHADLGESDTICSRVQLVNGTTVGARITYSEQTSLNL